MAIATPLKAIGVSGGEASCEPWFWSWDADVAAVSPSHAELQRIVRRFIHDEVLPNIADWEEAGGFPQELRARAYEAGVLAIGWPSEYGGTGPSDLDMWHKFVLNDELACACAGGLNASLFTHGISLPPLLALGSEEQKAKYARDIICGHKTCSLAITEPGGGSDVAAMQTTATRDGDNYVINGVKAFISGGMNADYFTVGARTGPGGLAGISLFMVHRDSPGLTTTRMKTQGWHCSTTTTVAFDGVRVPTKNLLGAENAGFLPIMLNFNSERYSMAVGACRMARCCLEDAIKYARVRKTFGRPLANHQVIRHKVAEMARHVFATHGMIATITRGIIGGADMNQSAGQLALAKVQATRTMELCAREASQILGGKAYLRGSGPGGRIERCYREVRVFAIGGGSEEIMLELAMRQAKL
eukprot:TRINITY_DN29051_c0_g1_i1.p1 TRINITY_DN29051_c0_g1~~TRINITY_DN29051_c0_g1_i1.p1  ORF type:complete len:416 (-),score=78.02 TRINITY_DN29051_c0_g1_i1:121-1368(-)